MTKIPEAFELCRVYSVSLPTALSSSVYVCVWVRACECHIQAAHDGERVCVSVM